MKLCKKCNNSKNFSEFWKNKKSSDGYTFYCIKCFKEVRKDSDKKYQQSDKGKKTRSKAVAKYWRSENGKKTIQEARRKPERIKKERYYYKQRKQIDPVYKLKCDLRRRLNLFLKLRNWKKTSKISEYLGCSPEYLKVYLENQFQPGMSWENRHLWHIDHIIPLGSANTSEKVIELCHYTNLQPLWAIDNLKKGNKIK